MVELTSSRACIFICAYALLACNEDASTYGPPVTQGEAEPPSLDQGPDARAPLDQGAAPHDSAPIPVDLWRAPLAEDSEAPPPPPPPDAGQIADAWVDPCAAPEVQPRGLLSGGVEGVILSGCVAHEWRFTAAKGRRIFITATPWSDLGEARLALTHPDVEGLAPAIAGGVMTIAEHPAVIFTPTTSGEHRLIVYGAPGRSGRYDLELACDGGCPMISRHPILMVHGWTGWAELMAYTYFHGVQEHLEAAGFEIFIAELDPYNSTIIRSAQLAAQVDEALAAAHARRLNIIAHSQGGLDSRRVISALGYGDRIATLTTISTPHRGTPLLDVGLGLMPGAAEAVLSQLLNLLGATVTDSESDARASFEAMTEAYVRGTFNPENPDDPQVKYISYAGHTCYLGVSCGDICDIEIQWSHALLQSLAGENDGIVPVSSAIWGDYRGEIPADHFDEVGQLAGITGPNFDHLEFYLRIATDLAEEGY